MINQPHPGRFVDVDGTPLDAYGHPIETEAETTRTKVEPPEPGTLTDDTSVTTLAAMDAERREQAAAREQFIRAPYAPESIEGRYVKHEPIDREAIAAQVAEIERANEGKPASAI